MGYQIRLYYGYEDNECGLFHTFEATDPDVEVDSNEMKEALAGCLDLSSDDDRFDWNSMYINLPPSLIDRIKYDAIEEYEAALSAAGTMLCS